jgi:hypothetical protein
MYGVVNKNVCGWSISDFSCNSEASVRMSHSLNNGGGAQCTVGYAPINHGAHAGWESDAAVSSANGDEWFGSWWWTTTGDAADLASSLGAAAVMTPTPGYSVIKTSDYKGHYSDGGYAFCDDNPHSHYPD